MNKNSIVKFVNESDEEKEARESGLVTMVVLWVDAPRVMVSSCVRGMAIQPTSIYNLEDLEVVCE